MKNTIITLVVLAVIGIGIYVFIGRKDTTSPVVSVISETNNSTTTQKANPPEDVPVDKTQTVIGTSVNKNVIKAYHFGEGSDELLFVGGLHGGYEWNTVLLAYELMDYLKTNPQIIPKNVKVTIIPVVNPDGLEKVVGTTGRFTASDVSASENILVAGRFNANNVDLNRNFDCDWQSKGVWRTTPVSGGSAVFSEPETQAVRDYITANKPTAAVVWYSAGGGVFASNCHNGVSTLTNTLTSTFSKASGYKAFQSFDFYETTGDMVNWLAKNNIPGISVLLTNHKDTEFSKNKAGLEALLKYYTK